MFSEIRLQPFENLFLCFHENKTDQSENLPPPRKPLCSSSIRFQWRERDLAESLFAVNQNTCVVAELAKFMRLDFVFLGFGIVDAALAGA